MDEAYNYGWAKCLATGQWISPFEHLRVEPYFRAPLYSYFLAGLILVFGGSLFWIRLVQIVLGSASCALAYGVGTKCFGSRVGALTGILCALHWVLVYFDGEILLPTLLVFLIVLGFLLARIAAERNDARLAGAAGLVFGLFAVTQPTILAFYPFLVRWAWLEQRGRPSPAARRFILAFVATSLMPPALATVRNGVVGHDWVIVASQGGVNFYIGNNPESNGMDAVVPGTSATWWGGYNDTHRIAEEAAGRPLRPSEVSRYWTDRGIDYIRSHPVQWLGLLARKGLAWIGDPEVGNNEPYEERRGEYRSLWMPTGFGLLVALFFVSLPWQRRTPAGHRLDDVDAEERRRRFAHLILQFLAVYTLTYLAFFVNGRYRVPLVPFLALGASLAVVVIADLARTRRFRQAALLSAVAAALVVALKVDYLGIRQGSQWYAGYSAAVEQVDLGKLDDGIARFEKLLDVGGVFEPEVYATIIRAYERRGRPEDRREMMLLSEYALQYYPQDPDLLGYAMRGNLEAGNWAAAQQRAKQYTQLKPDDPTGWHVWMRAALALGSRVDAERILHEAAQRCAGNPAIEQMQKELDSPAHGLPQH